MTTFDVAVVGASTAGCTAARLFGKRGLTVALLEQRPDPDAYKVTCTHAILSSASPTIDRLGLAPLLAERGAIRIHGDGWTPYSGWLRPPDDAPRGWGVTRRTLDPMLRKLAADTPGVELMTGRNVTGLLSDERGRPNGVEAATRDGEPAKIRARLVVAADGRHSTVARLAGVRGRVKPNNRFAYFAYWRGVRPQLERARVWLLDPDGAAHFPNEDDIAVLVAVAHRSRLQEFRDDLEGVYGRWFDDLEDAPDLSGAERISKVLGVLDHENVFRPAARPGLALVGDAAVAADPLWGVGISWAFQSGEWLVQETADALSAGASGDLDRALNRYRRAVALRLGLHHVAIAEYSSGRKLSAPERTMSRAIPHEPRLVRAMDDVASRRHLPLRMLDPRLAPYTVRGLARSVLA